MTEQELKEYYNGHTKKQTWEHFGLTRKRLDTILSKYGVRKYDGSYVKASERLPDVDLGEFREYMVRHSKKEAIVHFGITVSEYNKVIANTGIDVHALRFEHAFQALDKDEFTDYYILHGQKKSMTHFSMSEKCVKYVVGKLGISDRLKQLREMRYDEIDKNEFIEYYKGHSRDETMERFGIPNEHFFKDYCNHIQYKKPDSAIMKRRIETNMSKYGVPYYCMSKEFLGAQSHGSNSKPNLRFEKLLESNGIEYEREFSVGRYNYDFKVGDTLIEINPSATHNVDYCPFGRTPMGKYYHRDKTLLANINGYRCVNVWDWDNENGVVELLKGRKCLQARKCSVREVPLPDAKEFISKNHIQGYAKDQVRLGLYSDGELVSIMTFGAPRYNKNYQWELVRYCSSANVAGGAERLFSHFVREFDPKSIVSYCDLSKFSGETYAKLGFKLKRTSAPTCHWYSLKSGKHITDNLLRQRGFDQLFGEDYGKGSSNEQLMLGAGFVRVYDCGQATYIYEKEALE